MTWAKLLLALSNLGSALMRWSERRAQHKAGEDSYAREVAESELDQIAAANLARRNADARGLPVEDSYRRD